MTAKRAGLLGSGSTRKRERKNAGLANNTADKVDLKYVGTGNRRNIGLILRELAGIGGICGSWWEFVEICWRIANTLQK